MAKTKKENLMEIKAILAVHAPEQVAFIDHEIELLEKKNSSRGQSKVQKANAELKEVILDALTKIGEPITITELQAKDDRMAQYSNQKLSALLNQMAGKEVTKVTDKKKSYFSIVTE